MVEGQFEVTVTCDTCGAVWEPEGMEFSLPCLEGLGSIIVEALSVHDPEWEVTRVGKARCPHCAEAHHADNRAID